MIISTNFNEVKINETICYYCGNLPSDKIRTNYDGTPTKQAAAVKKVADEAYSLSTIYGGAGEFELKQKKIGFNVSMYLARRIK